MEGDYHVGQILDTLKELGVDDNTLVVFASDNGPQGETAREMGNQGTPDMGNSGPFRGELGEVTEGSIRTFCFVRWPGKVKPGTTSYAMFSIMDFLPTFAHIIGAKMPTDRPIDGVDQTDVLFGKSETGNRESLLTFIGGDLVAARWKQWRIYFTDVHPTGIGPQRQPGMFSASAPMAGYPKVYNIEMDPHEDLHGRRAVRLDRRARARGGREVPGVGQEISESARAQPHEVLRWSGRHDAVGQQAQPRPHGHRHMARTMLERTAAGTSPPLCVCAALPDYWLSPRPGPFGVGLVTAPPGAAPVGSPRPSAAGAPCCTAPPAAAPVGSPRPWAAGAPCSTVGDSDFFFMASFCSP